MGYILFLHKFANRSLCELQVDFWMVLGLQIALKWKALNCKRNHLIAIRYGTIIGTIISNKWQTSSTVSFLSLSATVPTCSQICQNNTRLIFEILKLGVTQCPTNLTFFDKMPNLTGTLSLIPSASCAQTDVASFLWILSTMRSPDCSRHSILGKRLPIISHFSYILQANFITLCCADQAINHLWDSIHQYKTV